MTKNYFIRSHVQYYSEICSITENTTVHFRLRNMLV